MYMEEKNQNVAVIPKGMVITGNIETSGSIEMHGEVRGNVMVSKVFSTDGEVHGDIQADNICMREGFVKGKMEAKENISIEKSSVVIGDVAADTLQVEGAIQGNLDIKDRVKIGATAIVDGDVTSKTIQIDNGAVISGRYTQAYADINPTEYFKTKERI